MGQVPGQLDLLGWEPPKPVARYEAQAVRASTIPAMTARAVAAALRGTEVPREVIAQRMGAYLGQPISRHMLDAYASQARGDHPISIARFIALVHATGDRRLLQIFADLFEWAVIERQYLPMIELAAVQQQRQALARQARILSLQAARRQRSA